MTEEIVHKIILVFCPILTLWCGWESYKAFQYREWFYTVTWAVYAGIWIANLIIFLMIVFG